MEDHISICICTYRRNGMLENLLRKIALQNTGGLFNFSVIVIDNDVSGPARETVIRLKNELGIDISYDVEPEQTIPAARNHALRLAHRLQNPLHQVQVRQLVPSSDVIDAASRPFSHD